MAHALKTNSEAAPQRKRKAYRRRTSASGKAGSSRRRNVSAGLEDALAEQKEAEQRRINKAIDERMKLPLESRVYQPGTPEFEALAQIYLARG